MDKKEWIVITGKSGWNDIISSFTKEYEAKKCAKKYHTEVFTKEEYEKVVIDFNKLNNTMVGDDIVFHENGWITNKAFTFGATNLNNYIKLYVSNKNKKLRKERKKQFKERN